MENNKVQETVEVGVVTEDGEVALAGMEELDATTMGAELVTNMACPRMLINICTTPCTLHNDWDHIRCYRETTSSS